MRKTKLFSIIALLLIIPLAASIPFAVLPDTGVNGTVKDAFGEPIEGAEINILGSGLNDITDENGNYFIKDVPAGSYDIVASALDQGFGSETKPVTVDGENIFTVDFTLYTFGSDCRPDCSKTTDEENLRCHADCDGINGCKFYDERTKEACTTPINRVVGVTESYNETYKLRCCEGTPYFHKIIKGTSLKFPENTTTIVRITRIVFFRGQFARMIVDMFK